jgi:ribosomal protein S18 acetylase RimI-like enzyme
MAVTVVDHRVPFRGLRRLNPGRDLRQVSDLIAQTFGGVLDADGQAALREMRQVSRLGPLVGFLMNADPQLRRFLNGHVWIEEGRVVGNLTLQESIRGNRWYISNVAVAPAYRQRGIAGALVDAALREIQREGGGWAVLQVEEANEPALRLYTSAGFESLAGLAHLQLPPQAELWTSERRPHATVWPALRSWKPDDWRLEQALARSTTPKMLQWWQPVRSEDFRLYAEERLGEWLDRLVGRQSICRWVVAPEFGAQDRLDASLMLRATRWQGEHEVRLLVHPDARGQLEEPLVQHALAILARFPARPTNVRHPAEHEAAIEVFLAHGFVLRRTLLAMRKRV